MQQSGASAMQQLVAGAAGLGSVPAQVSLVASASVLVVRAVSLPVASVDCRAAM
jgi:hypothetical protein